MDTTGTVIVGDKRRRSHNISSRALCHHCAAIPKEKWFEEDLRLRRGDGPWDPGSILVRHQRAVAQSEIPGMSERLPLSRSKMCDAQGQDSRRARARVCTQRLASRCRVSRARHCLSAVQDIEDHPLREGVCIFPIELTIDRVRHRISRPPLKSCGENVHRLIFFFDISSLEEQAGYFP